MRCYLQTTVKSSKMKVGKARKKLSNPHYVHDKKDGGEDNQLIRKFLAAARLWSLVGLGSFDVEFVSFAYD